MIVEIILFCSVIVLVSTNPVAPTIPVQTYPIYQQNDFKLPLDTISRNINPCTLQNAIQSQSSFYGPSIPVNLRQILFNKFLSRPEAQAILDPHKQIYSIDSFKTPVNPEAQTLNKYILLPVEYKNINENNTNIFENSSSKQKNTASKKRTKKGSRDKSKNKQCDSKYKLSCKETNAKTKKKKKCIKRNKDKCNKNNRKMFEGVKHNTKTANKVNSNKNENSRNTKSSTEENQRTQEIYNVYCDKENRLRNKKSRICRRKAKVEEEMNSNHTFNADISEADANIYNDPTFTVQNSTIMRTIKVLNSSLDNNDHKNKNDVLLNDFLKTFPNIPESMAKIILGGFNQFSDPPMNTFFGNYEMFYQSLLKSTKENMGDIKMPMKRKKKSRKKRRHRRKKKHSSRKKFGSKSKSSSFRLIPSNDIMGLVEYDKENSTNISIHTFFDGVGVQRNIEFENDTVGSIMFSDDAYEGQFYDNTDVGIYDDELTDFNKKNSDHDTSYYGWFKDYYPIFTDSAAYNANNKEIFVKNWNNDQYFYTRDDEPDYMPFNREQDENYGFLERHSREKGHESQAYTKLEETKMKNPTTVISRNPLLLESPDFRTRKVDKSEIGTFGDQDTIYNDLSDKSSSYSNTKKTFNVHKQSSPKLHLRDRINDVETVFARSKVAKFGTLSNVRDKNIHYGADIYQDFKENEYQNDGTTYVIAETVSDPLQFFEL